MGPRLPHLSHVGDRDTASGLCGSRSIALDRQLHRGSLQTNRERSFKKLIGSSPVAPEQ